MGPKPLCGVSRYCLGLNKQVGTVWAVKIFPYRLIFCAQVEGEKCVQPNFPEKIILMTRIWSKSVFRSWSLRWMTNISIFSWFLKKKKCTLKRVCYIHSPLIWAHMAKVNCPNNDFSFRVFVWTSVALQITVLIVKSGHMDSYFKHK